MRKSDLKRLTGTFNKDEIDFEKCLEFVTDEDCQNEDFCKNFQTDSIWRNRFYLLRREYKKLEKEDENWESIFNIKQDNKKLSDDLEKLKKKFHFPDLADVQSQVLMFLLRKERDKATELIVEYIKSKTKLYTTRKDSGSQVYIYDKGIYIPNGETYIEEVTRLILQHTYNSSFCNNIKDKIRADTYIDEEQFFKENINEIAVNNGILNIKSRILMPFDENTRFFSKIPVDYVPELKCDKIIEFFEDIIEYDDDIILLQEFFGYILYKSYPIEKAFMLLGKGRNGKGQFLELIKRFVGAENSAAISLQKICDDTSFDLSELHKKLVNVGGDIPDTFIKETGIFKSLTGNDYIGVRRKFLNNLNFINYAKLIFACNKLPRSSDNSIGFWSRWILINFPYRFVDEEELKTLSEEEKKTCKLRKNDMVSYICDPEQLSGLLNWALDGLDKLLEKGYFTYTTSNKNIQDRWIKAADSFAAFCSECLQEEYGTYIMKDELRKVYNNYCRKNKIEQVGDKAIKNYLTKEMGVSEFREQNIIKEYMWKNISFKENTKKSYDFGVLSTFSAENSHEEVANNQANQINHLFSIPFSSKNLEIIEYKKGSFVGYPSYLIKIKEIIAKIPENNADLLVSLFGVELIDKFIENGDMFLKDSTTYRVV